MEKYWQITIGISDELHADLMKVSEKIMHPNFEGIGVEIRFKDNTELSEELTDSLRTYMLYLIRSIHQMQPEDRRIN